MCSGVAVVKCLLNWQNLISEISVVRRSLLTSETGARSSSFGLI